MQLQKILATDNSLAGLVLRVGLGLALIPHGAQKLFGWFGGHGLRKNLKIHGESLMRRRDNLHTICCGA